ncbi:MAG: metalloregulator ArsR/SmtB family transcription factor [Chloroflexota bacterium]
MTTRIAPRARTPREMRRVIRSTAMVLDGDRNDGPTTDTPVIGPEILERAARVIRVLGHPLRLRLLEVLETGETHVNDLVAASGAPQALVSQHLAILRSEDVVGARREGLRVFYRITEPKVHRILACIRDCDLPDLSDGSAGPALDLTPGA